MFDKPHSYGQRLKRGESIHDVVPDFVNDLMDNYEVIDSKQVAKFFKEADRVGRSIAHNSRDIERYYKLVPNWVQILLAQLALFAAEETGGKEERDRIEENFRSLCKSFGWNAEDAINPTYDNTRTVMKFVYQSETGNITFNIILECYLKYPIGAVYVSPKGYEYAVNIPAENGDNMMECLLTGKLIPLTDYQLARFKRVR